jgi:hypothetical protein
MQSTKKGCRAGPIHEACFPNISNESGPVGCVRICRILTVKYFSVRGKRRTFVLLSRSSVTNYLSKAQFIRTQQAINSLHTCNLTFRMDCQVGWQKQSRSIRSQHGHSIEKTANYGTVLKRKTAKGKTRKLST